ncbi:hypothetical protein HJFPF1_09124 [Paramyrothecium foliicola]|nr:hypothetical protein HJFPF1_09124 [Paramyrothecium foliicola]
MSPIAPPFLVRIRIQGHLPSVSPPRVLQAATIMDSLRDDLPMSMTLAAFTGISWYIGVEINISLFMLFRRQRGLYFWSCALCSWGVILQPLFIILADFQIWPNLLGSIIMIYLTWFIMVVPQSWVLYSRLHLIVQNQKLLRIIMIVLSFNSIIFSVPTIVIGTVAASPPSIQATDINPALRDKNIIWDRVQLIAFFVQETSLSLLYIWETRKHVRISSYLNSSSASPAPSRGEKTKSRVLWNLINANLLVIVLDIALLGIQFGGDHLFYLQGAFKPCVYGIKLKVEFLVLNQLIESLQSRTTSGPYRSNPNGDVSLLSNTSKPKSGSSDPLRVKAGGKQTTEHIDLEAIGRATSERPRSKSRDGHSAHSNMGIVERDDSTFGRPAEPWDGTNEASWRRIHIKRPWASNLEVPARILRAQSLEQLGEACSYESPLPRTLSLLPFICGNDDLWALATKDLRSQGPLAHRTPIIVGQEEVQGSSGVVVPNLCLVDLVPDGLALPALEEIVDGGADGAVPVRLRVTEGFHKVSLLDIGNQAKLLDDLLRRVFRAGGPAGLDDGIVIVRQSGGRGQQGREKDQDAIDEHA